MHCGTYKNLYACYPFAPGDVSRSEELWQLLGDFNVDFIRGHTVEPLGFRFAKFQIASRDALNAANALRDAGYRHYMVWA